jgi:uncharacterized protein YegL
MAMAVGGARSEQLEEDAKTALPIYLVVDTSWSMSEEGKIEAVYNLIPKVRDACEADPQINKKVRFSLIEFSNEATVLIPMCQGSDLGDVALEAGGSTDFTRLYQTLYRTIENDYQSFKADGLKVHRPVVFFLTDGEPNCDPGARKTAFDQLTDHGFSRRPQIIAFGVGVKVSADTLSASSTKNNGKHLAYIARSDVAPDEAIASFIKGLVGTIVNTISAGSGAINRDDDGTTVLDIDPVADATDYQQLD